VDISKCKYVCVPQCHVTHFFCARSDCTALCQLHSGPMQVWDNGQWVDYRMVGPGFESLSWEQEIFLFCRLLEVLLWPHVLCSVDNRVLFLRGKWFGHETDISPPASAEVKLSGAGPLYCHILPWLHGQGDNVFLLYWCRWSMMSTVPECVMPNWCPVLGEGKFTLEHAMQAQRSSRCTALLFL
jgi:hypothetical protein